MTYTHPIQPTPEQFTEWLQEVLRDVDASKVGVICDRIARFAYAAGADAELEACLGWLADQSYGTASDQLRAARRPKPPSIKQQALHVLSVLSLEISDEDTAILAKALNLLPDQ